MTDSAIA